MRLPSVGSPRPPRNLEQSGLSGPVTAGQGYAHALIEGPIDIFEEHPVVKTDSYFFENDLGIHKKRRS